MRNLNLEKEALYAWMYFTKMSKANDHPIGENSPNLVTLEDFSQSKLNILCQGR
jgi:hypothetical protein